MAGSGYWRCRFEYQEPTHTSDGVGQAELTWAFVCHVRGNITPSQREVMDDMGVVVRTDVVIETAYHPSLKANGRLIRIESPSATTWDVYNISGVVEESAVGCVSRRS